MRFWRIDMLGGLRGRYQGREVVKFPTQLTGALLGYLAYHIDREVSRDELLLVLWPDDDPGESRNRLNQLLFQMRKLLEPPEVEKGSVLRTSRLTVRLDSTFVDTDVAEFRMITQSAPKASEPEGRAEALTKALNLYAGDFMAGTHLEWVFVARQEWADRFVEVSREASSLFRKVGKVEEALRISRAALKLDALDENLHRDVIETYMAMNQPGKGLRQYRELERVLREELGIAPSAVSRALFQHLEKGEATESTLVPDPDRPRIHASTLPVYASRFFGRAKEIGDIHSLLRTHRLITLVGPGGIGKTRLAVEALLRVQSQGEGSVWFVGLQDDDDANLIASRVRETLRADPQPDPFDSVGASLANEQNPIILLDNTEQFGQKAGPEILKLLKVAPTLRIMVTSRHSMALGETADLSIQPLETPRSAGRSASELARLPSVQMFLERAKVSNPAFQMTQLRADTIARISEKLEGIPLAIELAAAWTSELTVAQILDRLSQKLDLLATSKQDSPERHRTLRATLDHSFNLLRPELQTLFSRLSIFRGGWTAEAAEFVCADEVSRSKTILFLADLHERSLVSVEMPSSTGEDLGLGSRYRMLETVREYAREQLSTSETEGLEVKHAEYFLKLAAEAESGLRDSHQAQWIARLAAENDNIVEMIERSIARNSQDAGFALVARLWRYWYFHGRWDQGRKVIGSLFASLGNQTADSVPKAEAMIALGFLNVSMADFEIARHWFEIPLVYARSQSNKAQSAASLNGLGCVAREMRDYDAAASYYSEALQIASGAGDAYLHAAIAANFAEMHAYRGQWKEAREAYRYSNRLWDKLGTDFFIGLTLLFWAHCEFELGATDAAVRRAKKAVDLVRKRNLSLFFGWAMAEVALIGCQLGAFEDAALLLGATNSNIVSAATLRQAGPINKAHTDSIASARNALGRVFSKAQINKLVARGADSERDAMFDVADRVLRRIPA